MTKTLNLPNAHAGVVELVDAPDSKSGVRKDVSVRVRPPAPFKTTKLLLRYCVNFFSLVIVQICILKE